MLFTAGIEHRNALGHEQGGQRHILRHNEIASGRMGGDVLIGNIGTSIHPNGAYQRIARWGLKTLVRDQDRFDREPFGRSKHKVLDVPGCCIRINPDLQA